MARVSAKTLAKHEGTLLSTLIDGLRGMKSNKAMSMQNQLKKYLDDDIEKLAEMRKRIVLSSSVPKKLSGTNSGFCYCNKALFFLTSYWEGEIEAVTCFGASFLQNRAKTR